MLTTGTVVVDKETGAIGKVARAGTISGASRAFPQATAWQPRVSWFGHIEGRFVSALRGSWEFVGINRPERQIDAGKRDGLHES